MNIENGDNMESFADKINELNVENVYPFHMPGHKRKMALRDPYSIDITEVDGYDNLHNPEGMIKELEERIAHLYDGNREFIEKSYVLVNGSTCGILSAISAVTAYGDKILMARNSHKSAYNAVCIRGLDADYIYPEYVPQLGMNSVIMPENLRKIVLLGENAGNKGAGDDNGYRAVYITSPTYEGTVSDIPELSGITHKAGIPLIVDEAHGAHFGLAKGFPDTAIRNGADIVIQSIHKTLMGMTQTAVLHVSSDAVASGRVDIEKLEYYLRVYQSSSPSYVLMASVDECVRVLENKQNREKIFDEYRGRIEEIHRKSKSWKDIHIFEPESMEIVDREKIFDFDCGKFVIYSESGSLSGRELYDILRNKYGLQLEMSLGRYCLAMTSCMDSDEGFDRLAKALGEIDGDICVKDFGSEAMWTQGQTRAEKRYTISRAFEMKKDVKRLEEGAVAGEYGYVYPPGIPFIVPGEVVTKEILCDIMNAKASGYEVHGVEFREEIPYMKCVEMTDVEKCGKKHHMR